MSNLRRHDFVLIGGLKHRKDLNGTQGHLLEWREDTGRWVVTVMDPTKAREKVLVKPENLERLPISSASHDAPNHQSNAARLEYAKLCHFMGKYKEALEATTHLIKTLHKPKRKTKESVRNMQLSDCLCLRSAIFAYLGRNMDSTEDATLAIQIDPTNNGAYFNRALAAINDKEYSIALRYLSVNLDLVKDDVECLVKRAFVHALLKNFSMCYEDVKAACSRDLHKASVVKEFGFVVEYVAEELILTKDCPRVIDILTKALSASNARTQKRYINLLVRRSYALFTEGTDCPHFATDLELAIQIGLENAKSLKTMADFLLEQKRKWGESKDKRIWSFRLEEPATRPVAAILNDAINAKNEASLRGVDPDHRAHETLQTLEYIHNLKHAEKSCREKIHQVAKLEPSGSVFAESIFNKTTASMWS
ncbi:hypothetical protein ACA910_020498 [Epithemia clementina (nom. ined.)]